MNVTTDQSFSFHQVPDRETVRKELHADHYTPEKFIDLFLQDPELKKILTPQAVREGYSVEEHTLMTLHQVETYHPNTPFLRMFFLLHDIGKGIPKEKSQQHSHTLTVIEALEPKLPFNSEQLLLVKTLLSEDPLGTYVRGCAESYPRLKEKAALARKYVEGTLTEAEIEKHATSWIAKSETEVRKLAKTTADKLKTAAEKANMPVRKYLNTLLIIYSIDVSAYSLGAPRFPERSTIDTSNSFASGAISNKVNTQGKKPGVEHKNDLSVYEECEAKGPHSRAYPGLEILLKLRPDFRLQDDPKTTPAIVFNSNKGRLQFSDPVEKVIEILYQEL